MINPPLVTAVITTFQRPKLLQRAIESVQKQTFSNLSILVCDSASADETESIMNEMMQKDPRISYHRFSSRVTATQNFQFGMEQVKTPFFSFLADDDLLLPSFYETALSLLKKYPQAEFFLGSTIDAFLNGTPISAAAQNWPDQEFFLPQEGLPHAIQNYFNWTGSLFRTKTAQAHSINPQVIPGDYDFILNLAARYPFTFSSSPCALFTHHSGSFSNHCGLQLIYPSFLSIADSICKLRPQEELSALKTIFHRTFIRKCLQIFIQNLRKRNLAELEAIRRAIDSEPSFSNQMISTLFYLLIRFPLLHSPFLTAYSFYRWAKTLKIKIYLKKQT